MIICSMQRHLSYEEIWCWEIWACPLSCIPCLSFSSGCNHSTFHSSCQYQSFSPAEKMTSNKNLIVNINVYQIYSRAIDLFSYDPPDNCSVVSFWNEMLCLQNTCEEARTLKIPQSEWQVVVLFLTLTGWEAARYFSWDLKLKFIVPKRDSVLAVF